MLSAILCKRVPTTTSAAAQVSRNNAVRLQQLLCEDKQWLSASAEWTDTPNHLFTYPPNMSTSHTLDRRMIHQWNQHHHYMCRFNGCSHIWLYKQVSRVFVQISQLRCRHDDSCNPSLTLNTNGNNCLLYEIKSLATTKYYCCLELLPAG